jgi:hypothetical protein
LAEETEVSVVAMSQPNRGPDMAIPIHHPDAGERDVVYGGHRCAWST